MVTRRKNIIALLSRSFLGTLVGYLILHPLFFLTQNGYLDLCTVFSMQNISESYFFVVLGGRAGGVSGYLIYRYQQLKRTATIDELTGAYNRRELNSRLEAEVSRSLRFRRPLSVLMLDIDNFKMYNDLNGHDMGDYLLQELVNVINKTIRDSDFLARYGGEEFTIIAPETNRVEGRKLATRVRRAIQDYPFINRTKQPKRRVTVSIGVADIPNHAETPEEVMKKADVALYEAKRAGRNRVIVAETLLAKEQRQKRKK